MIDWSHIPSFLAVIRGGSLSEAARALGTTQPTVRRHIEALEEATGRVLFLRSPSGLEPTADAQHLLDSAEMTERGAQLFARLASAPAQQVAGTVRLSASTVMASEVLPPILATLRRTHPALRFELDASDTSRDVLQHEVDIAIRMAEPTQGDVMALRLGEVEIGFYAHRDWLAANDAPQSVEALQKSGALIGYDRDAAQAKAWQTMLGPLTADAFSLRSDAHTVWMATLRAGLGISVSQIPIANRDPALERVLQNMVTALPVWLVTHAGLRQQPRVAAVHDGLAAGLRAYLKS